MKYFLDTYALIEIAEGNKDYARYVDADVVTLKNNIAELFYFYLKKIKLVPRLDILKFQ